MMHSLMSYPKLVTFMGQLHDIGIETRFVGGCVRDYLLNEEPKDIDLCSPALPEIMMEAAQNLGYKVIETGLDHGTITVILDQDLKVEITTLRKDMNCDGRHATVEFTDSWQDDADRRDLTINAMMMGIDGTIYDWHDGQKDLENGLLKFVGDPDTRIKEDYLRILRFFRFATKFYAHYFDQESLDACYHNFAGLNQISGERIQSEMYKILEYVDPEYLLFEMDRIGILKTIGMDSLDRKRVDKAANYYGHDFSPSSLCILAATGSDPEPIIERWKLSSYDAKHLTYLSKFALETLICYPRNLEDDIVNDVPLHWVVDAAILCGFDDGIINDLFDFHAVKPIFPVTGDDLINRFGMKQGKDLGNVLKSLRWDWVDSRFKHTKNQLLSMLTE